MKTMKKRIIILVLAILVLFGTAFLSSAVSQNLIIPTVDRATISDIPPVR